MNAPVPTARARRPALLLWLFGAALLFALLALAAWSALHGLSGVPVQVVIDGHEAVHGLDLATMPPAHRVVLTLGLALVALAALVIVPLVLVIVVAVAVLAAALGIGLPLVAVLLLLAVVLSPLIAIGVLLWWALRRRAAPSATMPA